MSERLLDCHLADRFERPGAERPSRSCQYNAAYVFAPARTQSLEDGVVLGVDRQHSGAGSSSTPHEQRTGANETFLVGKRNSGAPFGSGQRRLQTGGTGDRGHHPVGRPLRRLDDGGAAGCRLDAGAGKLGFEFAVSVRVGYCGKACIELARELRQRLGVAMRRHGFDAITSRFLPQQIDGARPDRAGGAK